MQSATEMSEWVEDGSWDFLPFFADSSYATANSSRYLDLRVVKSVSHLSGNLAQLARIDDAITVEIKELEVLPVDAYLVGRQRRLDLGEFHLLLGSFLLQFSCCRRILMLLRWRHLSGFCWISAVTRIRYMLLLSFIYLNITQTISDNNDRHRPTYYYTVVLLWLLLSPNI